jgi:hypothetical protein
MADPGAFGQRPDDADIHVGSPHARSRKPPAVNQIDGRPGKSVGFESNPSETASFLAWAYGVVYEIFLGLPY